MNTYSVSFLRLLGGREEEREGSREGGRERGTEEEGRKKGREQTKKKQLKDTEQVEGIGMNDDCHGVYPLKVLSERRKQTQDIGPRHPWSWGGHEMGSMPVGINGFLAR